MKIRRISFLINSLWELVRFLLLFAALGVSLGYSLIGDPQTVYWLVLLGSGQLLLPAVLFFLYLDPERFAGLLNVARLGKFLGILAALLLLFLGPLSSQIRAVTGNAASASLLLPYTIVVAATIVDLIFLFLLFLHQPVPPMERRPEMR
jgi:hypothetical protein